jgi:hypothetical protein
MNFNYKVQVVAYKMKIQQRAAFSGTSTGKFTGYLRSKKGNMDDVSGNNRS